MSFSNYSELVLLSIKIASVLSASTPSSTLATLIDCSSDYDQQVSWISYVYPWDQISPFTTSVEEKTSSPASLQRSLHKLLRHSSSPVHGLDAIVYPSHIDWSQQRLRPRFVDIMSVESLEAVAEAEASTEETAGTGAPDKDETQHFGQAISLSAFGLRPIQETEASRPNPNIAHFLLFGTAKQDQQIQDPHALGARWTSIHVRVNAGVPRIKVKGKEYEQDHSTPLFPALLGLAEKCCRVIYQLCTHLKTLDFTTRYLRTREDFFAYQLAKIPS